MYTKQFTLERTDNKENKRRPLNASPYSINYKSNLTHDQRALISHRTHVSKLHRSELEDRYLLLLDEHFALKKENLCNHDKIRKLVTKILRLSAEHSSNRINSASSKQVLSADEDLHLRIIDLESHNSQLRERLNGFIRNNNINKSRCASAVALRGSSSTPSLMRSGKTKLYQSHENISFGRQSARNNGNIASTADLTLSRRVIKTPMEINEKTDDQNASEFIATAVEDIIPESSESESEFNVKEDEIKELKDIIEKLQQEIINQKIKSESNSIKSDDEDKTLEAKSSKKTELELVETIKKLSNCEQVMQQKELRFHEELENLKKKTELAMESHRSKIFDLTVVIEKEMEKNKQLLREKESLEADLRSMQIIKQETSDIQAENELLKKHRENIAALASELAARMDRIKELRRDNEDIRADLIEAQANIAAMQSVHTDMMQKIQLLQDANDELTVQMEGIRAQCQCLTEFNVMLGDTVNRPWQTEICP